MLVNICFYVGIGFQSSVYEVTIRYRERSRSSVALSPYYFKTNLISPGSSRACVYFRRVVARTCGV